MSTIGTLKIRRTGGRAFPQDFNWFCPNCGYENRAFQLPPKEDGLYTLAELSEACQQCQHTAQQAEGIL